MKILGVIKEDLEKTHCSEIKVEKDKNNFAIYQDKTDIVCFSKTQFEQLFNIMKHELDI